MSGMDVFHVDEIDIRLEPHDWAWAREHQTEIDAHWRETKARRSGVFDGRVLLLRRYEQVGPKFVGACFEAPFSRFNAWRRFGFPDLSVRNFFGMAALRSADGAFLLGEMRSETANAGECYFPAGTPEPADLVNGRVDLAGSVVRELQEETGLAPERVAIRAGWDVAMLGGQIAFIRELRVALEAEDLARQLEAAIAAQEKPELARIHVVRAPAEAERLTMPPFMLPYLRWAFAQPG